MTHWRSMRDRDTLASWDLVGKDGKPKDFTLEIERVEQRIVKSREKPNGDRCPFIFFKGAKKPLVCNATNGETIEAMAGSEHVERWVGLRITLFATMVKGKSGKKVPGIRVRPMKPQGPVNADELVDQPVDEAMRAEQQEAAAGEREPGDD